MRKALLTFLLLVCVWSDFTAAWAEETSLPTAPLDDTKLELLKTLHIMNNIESEQPVTRGEFSKILLKMSGVDVQTDQNTVSRYQDVNKSDGNLPYIEKASELGYMNGVSETEFKPDDPLRLSQALTPVVRILGYEEYAVNLGGYPGGYVSISNQIGLLKDIQTSSELTGPDVAQLCWNALHTEVLQLVRTGAARSYETRKDETLLSENHKIYRVKGVLNGNRYLTINANQKCGDTEIQINKESFAVNAKLNVNYIGQYVEGYYRQNNDLETPVIILLAPVAKKNNLIRIPADDIVLMDNNRIGYYWNNKLVHSELQAGYEYIVNNQLKSDRTFLPQDGTVTLIDNNIDDIYEVVSVEQYETLIVTGVDLTAFVIYCENDKISIVPEEKNVYFSFSLMDEAGSAATIDIDELKTNDILTVKRSEDEKYTDIAVCRNVIESDISTIEEEKVGIVDVDEDEVFYKLVPGFDVSDLKVGSSYIFYLDIYNRIAKVEKRLGEHDYHFGYLFKTQRKKPLAHPSEVQLITSNGAEILELESKILLDGKKASVSDAIEGFLSGNATLKQMIRYKLNSGGKITAIDTEASDAGGEGDILCRDYSAVSKTYYKNVSLLGSNVIIGSDTLVVNIPNTAANLDDLDYYSSGFVFSDNTGYKVDVFNVGEADMEAGAVLVYDDSGEKAPKIDGYSSFGVVEKVTQGLNKDGDRVDIITIYSGNKTIKYAVDPKIDKNIYVSGQLGFGDAIRYTANKDGYLANIVLDFDYSKKELSTSHITSFSRAYGLAYNKQSSYFILIDPKDNVDYADKTVLKRIILGTGNATYYYVDEASKTISRATLSNMSVYAENGDDANCVYAMQHYLGSAYPVVIYK